MKRGFRKLGEPLFAQGLTQRLALGNRAVAGVSDTTAPTVTITSAVTSPAMEQVVGQTITFSEAVTGFVVSDITISAGGSLADFATADNIVFTVSWTLAAGANTMDVNAGVCTDAAGNANTAASQFAMTWGITAPAITPTLGAEALANPGMEGTYDDESGGTGTINIAPNWNKQGLVGGTDTADTEAITIHGGSASQKIIATANVRGVKTAVNLAVGWYQISAWIYKTAGAAVTITDLNETRVAGYVTASNAWIQGVGAGFVSTAGAMFVYARDGATTFYVDDCSAKAITFSSMRSLLGTRSQKNGTYICHPTVAVGSWAGMLVNYADDNNWVAMLVDRRVTPRAYLWSCIGGIYNVSVKTGTITYGDAKELKLTDTDGTYRLYYDSVQVSTDATIAEATLGTQVHAFNTLAGNEVGNVTTSPFDLTTSHSPNGASATRAAAAQTIPTPDETSQAVHPDVYDAGTAWNSHRYWMVMEPYANSDASLESPCIIVSADGATWSEPVGITNPIEALHGGPNADGDLIVDQASTMWCVYRRGNFDVMAKSSTDGVTWSAEAVLFGYTAATEAISPAVIWDGTQYCMYAVNRRPGGPASNYLTRRTAASVGGPWSAPSDMIFGVPSGREYLWHLDVIYSAADDLLYGLFNFDEHYLYFALSEDNGLTWYVASNPIINPGTVGQWDFIDYRGCLVRTATGFDMWYSAYNTNGSPRVWGIGRTPITWTF